MHPKSPTTSLTGQTSSEYLGANGTEVDEVPNPTYGLGTISNDLGASQDEPGSQTADMPEQPKANKVPFDVAPGIPITPEIVLGRGPTLQRRQLWEGTVTELRSDGFVATLVDKTDPTNPDEQAVFDYGEVSQEDHSFMRPGSAFYWTIGIERTPGGQLKNVSVVQFRRVPAWTQSALVKAADRSRRMKELFQSAERYDEKSDTA